MNRRDYIWLALVVALLLGLGRATIWSGATQKGDGAPARTCEDLAWMTTMHAKALAEGMVIDFPELYVRDTPTGPRWSGGSPQASPQWDETALRSSLSNLAAVSKAGKALLSAHEDTSARTLQRTITILHEYGFNHLAILGRVEGVYIEPTGCGPNTLERLTESQPPSPGDVAARASPEK